MHDSSVDYFINVRPQYLQDGGKKPVSYHSKTITRTIATDMLYSSYLLTCILGSAICTQRVPPSVAALTCTALSTVHHSLQLYE
jgi:hypothetical protein